MSGTITGPQPGIKWFIDSTEPKRATTEVRRTGPVKVNDVVNVFLCFFSLSRFTSSAIKFAA